MRMQSRRALFCHSVRAVAIGPVLLVLAPAPARADVAISSDATQNMSCSNGTCSPTASDAVLNVSDLETLLASGNVTVTTTGSGVQANNVDVTANLGWSGANTLTLDAFESISVGAAITIKGKSGLSLVTNDGGTNGELSFGSTGHVTFKKLSSKLTINGASYMLVETIAALAKDIAANSNGIFAFAASFDAGQNGTYGTSPIQTTFNGTFEGLGNTISNLTIDVPSVNQGGAGVGLFATIGQNGQVSDIGLDKATVAVEQVKGRFSSALLGALVGENLGTIARSYASGAVSLSGAKNSLAGGLVGNSYGLVEQCHADVRVKFTFAATKFTVVSIGGLVGWNSGQITVSYATGSVSSGSSIAAPSAGGLVGSNSGTIINSYATGKVRDINAAGGLIGYNNGDISTSYSIGQITGQTYEGGLIGVDEAQPGSISYTYWDTDTSGITNLSQGAGYPANDPGITGLTTAQLQSGLPAGFGPTIWGEDSNINNGLPYLLANPPT